MSNNELPTIEIAHQVLNQSLQQSQVNLEQFLKTVNEATKSAPLAQYFMIQRSLFELLKAHTELVASFNEETGELQKQFDSLREIAAKQEELNKVKALDDKLKLLEELTAAKAKQNAERAAAPVVALDVNNKQLDLFDDVPMIFASSDDENGTNTSEQDLQKVAQDAVDIVVEKVLKNNE